MSSRLVKALSADSLRVTNNEQASVSVEIRIRDEQGKVRKEVRILPPGKEINLTRLYSSDDLRRSPHLKKVVSHRKIRIRDTWSP